MNETANGSTLSPILEIIDHFKLKNHLENVNIYVTNSYDKLLFRSAKRALPRIKQILSVNRLAASLAELLKLGESENLTILGHSNQQQHEQKRKPLFNNSSKHSNHALKKALKILEASFLNKNDLIILKSDITHLQHILDMLSTIRQAHFTNNNHHLKSIISHGTILWIPEFPAEFASSSLSSTSTSSSLNFFKSALSRLIDKSNKCSLKIFIFNTLLSLDHLVIPNNLKPPDDQLALTYSLKSLESFFNYFNFAMPIKNEDLIFKVYLLL